jgi:CrcB protein
VTALAVALGGALGALSRYGLEGLVSRRQQSPFPLGTLVVNVTGSTLLGVLAGAVTGGLLPASSLSWAGTGFCGGYTTFSTSTYETLRLIEDGAWRSVALNVALSGPLSFAGAAAGYLLLK